ncbi:glucans biosynthesis glucosyltransferase MdoH [Thalassoglobus sp. JC818]|uniref:glucans biosynthesis glucosyltransferase MdoH n=1 Tax=Thalassoglobus sp. JC818 TaxID=3232136 RepID=UPI003458BE19
MNRTRVRGEGAQYLMLSGDKMVNVKQTLPTRPHWGTRTVRVLLAVLSILTTSWLSLEYLTFVFHGELNILEAVSVGLFSILSLWISFAFWVATIGFLTLVAQKMFRIRHRSEKRPTSGETLQTRNAILIPVYNESPAMVFASIRAMVESLVSTGQHKHFDFFVLSDTQKSEIWLQEERVWAETVKLIPDGMSLFYRRRIKNVSRKAGNLAEFCRRWGGGYEHMIVLDADSVMEGKTLVEMVHRMETDSHLGILQVPPKPVQRTSLFARLQQFAATIYGAVFLKGYETWTQSEGNYFGHNAIIRIAAFSEHCMLPVLPGKAPLGGEILSHDFVEAGLMLKAGFKVETADLGGSYEECPTTVDDYVIRDQRWCQGNLQHARLLMCSGFERPTRMHFATGVFSYLSAGLWILFMSTSFLGAYFDSANAGSTGSVAHLFLTMFAMLLAPKVWSFVWNLIQPERLKSLGGAGKLFVSLLLEILVSILIAPILAIYHTSFVVYAILGKSVQWSCQSRDDRDVAWRDAATRYWPHTALGVVLTLMSFSASLSFGLWMLPFTAGLMLSIPLITLLGSAQLGVEAKERGLFLIPEETNPPELLKQRSQYRNELLATIREHDFSNELFSDPDYIDLHLKILTETCGESEENSAIEGFDFEDWPTLSEQQRLAILSNAHEIRRARQKLSISQGV